MNGIVTGGWGYVWAAYTVSAVLLLAYSIHTIHGLRRSLANREAMNRASNSVAP